MKAVEFTGECIRLLDQSLLPHEERWLELRSVAQVAHAIEGMKVRGAPAIGVAAAYAMVFSEDPDEDARLLKSSRPTAVDLSHAVDFMLSMLRGGMSGFQAAAKWDGMNDERCAKVSEHGASLLSDGQAVLTHCNTGFIAANAHGTALGAIKKAHSQGKGISVIVDETRPRLQGALTSWELLKAGVPHKVICDSAAGSLMRQGKIDIVMVGADRIALNGDTANKIGTYPLSVLAKEHGIPFYVLAPLPSFDRDTGSGQDIAIEQREGGEVLSIQGKPVYPEGAEALNPAFDITPECNITAWINEDGIFRSMEDLWRSTRDPGSFSQGLVERYLK